jgi:CcmD family protein
MIYLGVFKMVNTYPDLFWAYTAVWVALALYIAFLGRRLSKLERSLPKDPNDTSYQTGCCDTRG